MIPFSFPSEKASFPLKAAGVLCLFCTVLPFVNISKFLPESLPPAAMMLCLILFLQGAFFLSVLIPALIRSKGSIRRLRAILWLRKLERQDLLFVLKTVLPLFFGISALSALFDLIGKLCGSRNPEQLILRIALNGDWKTFLAITLPAVLAAPVAEELAFRTVLYSFFRQMVSGLGAAFLSCVIFAAVHATPWQILTFTLLAGVFQYACFYRGRPSVLRSMLLHSLYNLCAVLSLLFMRLTGIGV